MTVIKAVFSNEWLSPRPCHLVLWLEDPVIKETSPLETRKLYGDSRADWTLLQRLSCNFSLGVGEGLPTFGGTLCILAATSTATL